MACSSSESSDHCHQFEDVSKSTEKISELLLDGQFAYDIETMTKSVSKTLLQVGKFATWSFLSFLGGANSNSYAGQIYYITVSCIIVFTYFRSKCKCTGSVEFGSDMESSGHRTKSHLCIWTRMAGKSLKNFKVQKLGCFCVFHRLINTPLK